MDIAAFVIVSLTLLLALFTMQRAVQAANDRENQPADSNDVVVAITLVGLITTMALMAVVLAVLS